MDKVNGFAGLDTLDIMFSKKIGKQVFFVIFWTLQ